MTVFEKVRDVLAKDTATDPDIITPDSLLEGGDLYASLDYVEGIMLCEEVFEITIADEDMASMENTIGSLASIVEKKLKEKPSLPSHLSDLKFE